jgi:predicted short-subunit dehydrogenase-like oxidoreductase (DUF2520 family)
MTKLPLAGLRFALAGPGRVGGSLAAWIAGAGGRLLRVAGRRPGPAAALAAELGGEAVDLGALASPEADLLLVAVPDDALAPVARELALRPQAAVVLHTCGSRGASALAPLAAAGSFHPLAVFAGRLSHPPPGLLCAIDGAAAARRLAARLASAFGAEACAVEEEQREAYHLAAVLGAGGLVTLLALAAEVAREAGLPATVRRGYGALSRGALEAALAAPDPIDALTGPWPRGDRGTVERHLALLERGGSGAGATVAGLVRVALRLAAARGPLSPEAKALGRALESAGFLDRPQGGC